MRRCCQENWYLDDSWDSVNDSLRNPGRFSLVGFSSVCHKMESCTLVVLTRCNTKSPENVIRLESRESNEKRGKIKALAGICRFHLELEESSFLNKCSFLFPESVWCLKNQSRRCSPALQSYSQAIKAYWKRTDAFHFPWPKGHMLNGKRRVTCAITQNSFRVKRNVTLASVPMEVLCSKGFILWRFVQGKTGS